jgi:carbon storage regulator
MLVIRRHCGESIVVGDDVEIQVIECAHNRVKLGIVAPRHVTVCRKEVQLTREQNRAAARSPDVRTLAGVVAGLRAPSPAAPGGPANGLQAVWVPVRD